MKAIIIAAGKGKRLGNLANNAPKCMLEIKGKTILQITIDNFKACGIKDIVIIKGYKAETINYPNIKYYYNNNYENNNILLSLMHAQDEMNDEFICCYSDIIFDKNIVERLLKKKEDISIVVDNDWKKNYEGRTLHPIEEAENAIINGNSVIEIGKHISSDKAHGEFIGMAKFNKKGAEILKSVFNDVKRKFSEKPFQRAKIFEKSYLTDIFQELIDRKYKVNVLIINGGWHEIDTAQDLEKVRENFERLN